MPTLVSVQFTVMVHAGGRPEQATEPVLVGITLNSAAPHCCRSYAAIGAPTQVTAEQSSPTACSAASVELVTVPPPEPEVISTSNVAATDPTVFPVQYSRLAWMAEARLDASMEISERMLETRVLAIAS